MITDRHTVGKLLAANVTKMICVRICALGHYLVTDVADVVVVGICANRRSSKTVITDMISVGVYTGAHFPFADVAEMVFFIITAICKQNVT